MQRRKVLFPDPEPYRNDVTVLGSKKTFQYFKRPEGFMNVVGHQRNVGGVFRSHIDTREAYAVLQANGNRP